MLSQSLIGGIGSENPVVEFESEISAGESFFRATFKSSHNEHLFGGDIGEQFVDIVVVSFGAKKFACRNVEEGDACGMFAEVNAGEEVVLTIVAPLDAFPVARP